ncbi:MAG: DUF1705 domain-containing protein [Pricia sp.]|nr:DUF1705 domain-containing protein [Pricia sp.]
MTSKFREAQQFTQWWLWLILLSVALIPIYGMYKQMVLGEQFGNNPMSDSGLILFACFVFGIICLFFYMRLITEIDQSGIQMNFVPFVKKKVAWKEVLSAQIVNYGFVGGWGIRLSTKYGTVYNIQGNKGLAIELQNGRKFLIGTQKETEMEEMVKKYFK